MLRVNVSWKRSDSAALKGVLTEAIHAELVAIAEETRDDAKSRAPVKTGALRDGIMVEEEGELHVAVVSTVPYASFVEHGTRTNAAQPHLTPAVMAAEITAPRRLAAAAREALEEASRR